jgi:hypothetical protein
MMEMDPSLKSNDVFMKTAYGLETLGMPMAGL